MVQIQADKSPLHSVLAQDFVSDQVCCVNQYHYGYDSNS